MRRIVLGHRTDGQAAVLADSDVVPIEPALLPGSQIYRMWELDAPPQLPVEAVPAATSAQFFPGPGGVRFGFIVIPPGLSYEPLEDPAELAPVVSATEAAVPGLIGAFDDSGPGMHTTHTVDFVVVIAGAGRMRLGDGTDVQLRPGDSVIQNGTPHAWFNDGSEPFVFCYALCGAN
ncbi:cupin domain-containing protein [Nocardia cyriacigeorgica]|uniref:Cupin domain-containing protein n=1 Tax=Nocardia cyriacigeorgica TaxID=135487 RepID=A0ABX0CVA9_9NOCA|nr:cupin domain-containing protein [Nocardia cyriacigeorgica]NEW40943.1 cupin domain-containing protein [Nocardia cyriacigeorgica]NEW59152.1 cupin domain-containing protein [Nocardia cyriacigeorgica]